jgi:predicted alpha-1,2-mannosidase
LGGDSAFTQKLDQFFTIETKNPDKFLGQEAMIGQYAHGNEPGHHVLYLYAYSLKPKTGQKYVHHVINNFYNNTPDGMIGNDDCGQMSAWYILSSLGFYPVNPSGNEFVMGSPQVCEAILHLPDGKTFSIKAQNCSPENIYADSVFMNNEALRKAHITYQYIYNGGNLMFIMSNK